MSFTVSPWLTIARSSNQHWTVGPKTMSLPGWLIFFRTKTNSSILMFFTLLDWRIFCREPLGLAPSMGGKPCNMFNPLELKAAGNQPERTMKSKASPQRLRTGRCHRDGALVCSMSTAWLSGRISLYFHSHLYLYIRYINMYMIVHVYIYIHNDI